MTTEQIDYKTAILNLNVSLDAAKTRKTVFLFRIEYLESLLAEAHRELRAEERAIVFFDEKIASYS